MLVSGVGDDIVLVLGRTILYSSWACSLQMGLMARSLPSRLCLS